MKKAIVIISVCVICVIIMLNGVSFISSPEQMCIRDRDIL